jgi:hypothetical protein
VSRVFLRSCEGKISAARASSTIKRGGAAVAQRWNGSRRRCRGHPRRAWQKKVSSLSIQTKGHEKVSSLISLQGPLPRKINLGRFTPPLTTTSQRCHQSPITAPPPSPDAQPCTPSAPPPRPPPRPVARPVPKWRRPPPEALPGPEGEGGGKCCTPSTHQSVRDDGVVCAIILSFHASRGEVFRDAISCRIV